MQLQRIKLSLSNTTPSLNSIVKQLEKLEESPCYSIVFFLQTSWADMFSLQTGWSESASCPCAGEIRTRTGANFINVFTHSYYESRSQKSKKLLNLTVYVALLGSTRVKAACKMIVKLTPGPLQCPSVSLGAWHFESRKIHRKINCFRNNKSHTLSLSTVSNK